jgi:hypothetical protein
MYMLDDSELSKMYKETERLLFEAGERLIYLQEGHAKGRLTPKEQAEYEQILKEADDLTDEEIAELENI